jgi:hypothetical protein
MRKKRKKEKAFCNLKRHFFYCSFLAGPINFQIQIFILKAARVRWQLG